MSQSTTHILDNPLDFPLNGSRLIEASAGTGKTYTIAALYVRLVIGHGTQDTAFGARACAQKYSGHDLYQSRDRRAE